MKFFALVLELHLPQNFCRTFADTHTGGRTEIFQKYSNRERDIPKRVNPSKKIQCSLSRRKYWFRANFRFPVFDGFRRFGMS